MGNWLKYIVIITVVLSLAVIGIVFMGRHRLSEKERKELYNIADEEKNRILANCLENGAICSSYKEDGEVAVSPYFSSIAAMALADYGSEDAISASKNFLKWYFGHINVDEDYNHLTGTVYDYKVHIESGSIKEEYNEMTYDSADSYAAVFLTALWHYYKATDDKEFLIENKTYTDAVSYCLLSLISDGYTISKPDYSISYLMDNCEVYDGLRCAEKIYRKVYADDKNADILKNAAGSMKKNFDTVWKEKDGYSYFLGNEKNNYENFYPDSVSQIYPVIYDLVNDKKKKEIYNDFCKRFKWEELDYYHENKADFYWSITAYCGACMRDTERVMKYIKNYKKISADGKYPLHVTEMAWIMMTAKETLNKN